MEQSTLWWLRAGAAVIAELLTGTFYLLMLALGLAAAALAAHLGAGFTVQLLAAALVGGGAVAIWTLVRQRRAAGDAALGAGQSASLDIGETLHIDHWNPDGTATVRYRGASWVAVHRPGAVPTTGLHRVAELMGNRLVVEPV